MPEIIRLTNRRQFLTIKKSGDKIVMPGFVLQYAPVSSLNVSVAVNSRQSAVGFTVTKKLGNAVKRNRIKRRLRAMVQQSFLDHAQTSYSYVVIGRWKAATLDFEELLRQSKRALQLIEKKTV